MINKVWSKERLVQAGIITEAAAGCDRCGAAFESDFHRFFECPSNDCIQDECIRKSNGLAAKAKSDHTHKAKWYRAILPGDLIGEPVGWQDEDVCSPTVVGDFDEILHSTAKTGTDRAGGPAPEPRTRVVAAGIFVMSHARTMAACILSRVPGKQTVPRSELWALLLVLQRMRTGGQYTVFIDASYVTNGLAAKTVNYSRGSNGDIWTLIFTELDRIGRLTSDEQWERYNMTSQ